MVNAGLDILILLLLSLILLMTGARGQTDGTSSSFVKLQVDWTLPDAGGWWWSTPGASPRVNCALACHAQGSKCNGFQTSGADAACRLLEENPADSLPDALQASPGAAIYGRTTTSEGVSATTTTTTTPTTLAATTGSTMTACEVKNQCSESWTCANVNGKDVCLKCYSGIPQSRIESIKWCQRFGPNANMMIYAEARKDVMDNLFTVNTDCEPMLYWISNQTEPRAIATGKREAIWPADWTSSSDLQQAAHEEKEVDDGQSFGPRVKRAGGDQCNVYNTVAGPDYGQIKTVDCSATNIAVVCELILP